MRIHRFTASHLQPVDFRSITTHDPILLRFALFFVKTPHLHEGVNTWMDESYRITELVKPQFRGAATVAYSSGHKDMIGAILTRESFAITRFWVELSDPNFSMY
ncbi:hypothetical protein Y032_0016g3088 [Ancylostoma ceylanicum]|uniref:Uncharacterized protein n=1 Tax=Ancylostoma ceylanicum TaxID=53326 RepID=A0A016V7T6_9BILA|nr:hypothetical protein Y032_0016g3088 [Ancylostoma ceylanicum]